MVQRTILNMHSWVIDSDFESKLFSIKTTKGHSSGEVWAVLKYPSISISTDIYHLSGPVACFNYYSDSDVSLHMIQLCLKVCVTVRVRLYHFVVWIRYKSFTYCIAASWLCQTGACQTDNHQMAIYIRNKIITSHNIAVKWTSLMITKRHFYSGYIRLQNSVILIFTSI